MERASDAGGQEARRKEDMRRPWVLAWTILLALILASPAWGQRVLVMPPQQAAGSPSTNWIGTGLAVALGEALTTGGVFTVPFEDLRSYAEQAGLVESPKFTLPAQVGLARQIGAGTLVAGTYEATGETVSVHLQVYSVAGDLKRLASLEESQDLSQLLALTQKLEGALFKTLGREWTPPAQVSPRAFESYIRGRIAGDPTLQEVYFRKAVELQPDYYDASCYLALTLRATGRITECTTILGELEKKSYSKAYLGLLTLAEIRMEQGRLADARRLLLASLKAAESAEGHIDLAQWYLKQKRTKEAMTELVVAERFGTHQEDIDALRRKIQEAEGAK